MYVHVGLQADLKLQQKWYVNGLNYSRTLDAWLQRQNDSKSTIMRCFEVSISSSCSCVCELVMYVSADI